MNGVDSREPRPKELSEPAAIEAKREFLAIDMGEDKAAQEEKEVDGEVAAARDQLPAYVRRRAENAVGEVKDHDSQRRDPA